MAIKNQVQLITYPDSLGGGLKTLNNILLKYFKDIFTGGVHILPPYPSSGDRGFAPLTYFNIEPKFGDWQDIHKIADNFDIMLDLMVNHISRQSSYFQDFLEKGHNSEYCGLFITLDKVWKDGKIDTQDIEKIFLRRKLPFSYYKLKNEDSEIILWTSFGKINPSEQIDLDVNSETTKKLLMDFLQNFKENKIKQLRLDAVGYVIKKAGTSCFFVEPEIFQFLNWISEAAKKQEIEILPEIHAHHSIQYKLAGHGFWIYDFILPYTILEALITKSSDKLIAYLKIRPSKQFTMLDCHDGIPVKPDMDDLIDTKEARKIIDFCLKRGGNLSKIYSPKHRDKDGFDVHQIRGTYFSLLDKNEDAYIAARAIQFFTPGIPQVYYVGLFAGENDNEIQLVDGRDINRHNYTLDEIELEIKKPVVQRLLKLIRFRNEYPAFNGTFKVENSNSGNITLSWSLKSHFCQLNVDLQNYITEIKFLDRNCEKVLELHDQ